MDQESEGTNLVIFVIGGVVLLLLLLGGGAFFFFAGWHEESARKDVKEGLETISKEVHDFKSEPMFPADAEKSPANQEGVSNFFENPPAPKAPKQLPEGPASPPPPK